MNKILHACGLESRPRWIELSYHGAWSRVMCSNCGETKTVNNKHIPIVCHNCGSKMGRSEE